jgi:putative SOS response-associated peptidase YedK
MNAAETAAREHQEERRGWFALNESRPLFAFAHLDRIQRRPRHRVQADPRTAPRLWLSHHRPNAVVEPIHPKAMPVILTTDEERDDASAMG